MKQEPIKLIVTFAVMFCLTSLVTAGSVTQQGKKPDPNSWGSRIIGITAGTQTNQPSANPKPTTTASAGVRTVVQTKYVYKNNYLRVYVPRALPTAGVLVNGAPAKVDALIRKDEVFVSMRDLAVALEPLGVKLNLNWDNRKKTVDVKVDIERKVESQNDFSSALRSLFLGDVSSAKRQLSQVSGPDTQNAQDLLDNISNLAKDAGDLGVVRFSWPVTHSKYRFFLEETEVLSGTLMMLAPQGQRNFRILGGDGRSVTFQLEVKANKVVVLGIAGEESK